MILLTVDNDFEVSISPEALELKVFKAIVTRDKGSKGDFDGRKKYRAKKEFAYIYNMLHPDSPFASLEAALRSKRLKEELFYEEEWSPDAIVCAAMNLYEELITTASVRVLRTLRRTLNTTDGIIQKVIDDVQKRVDTNEHTKMYTNRVGTTTTGVSMIMDDLNQLIKLSNQIPAVLETINKQEEKVASEKAANGRTKGGKTISERER